MMTLREMMIERILYACDEDEMRDRYQMEGDLDDELQALNDTDLFELYEDVYGLN